jgi:uracil-DNA glycosylase
VERLIWYALDNEGDRLRAELAESRAPLIITLGNEALAVAAAVLQADLAPTLSPDSSYGRRYPLFLNGRPAEVLPLVHPGQRSAVWTSAHDTWLASISE